MPLLEVVSFPRGVSADAHVRFPETAFDVAPVLERIEAAIVPASSSQDSPAQATVLALFRPQPGSCQHQHAVETAAVQNCHNSAPTAACARSDDPSSPSLPPASPLPNGELCSAPAAPFRCLQLLSSTLPSGSDAYTSFIAHTRSVDHFVDVAVETDAQPYEPISPILSLSARGPVECAACEAWKAMWRSVESERSDERRRRGTGGAAVRGERAASQAALLRSRRAEATRGVARTTQRLAARKGQPTDPSEWKQRIEAAMGCTA